MQSTQQEQELLKYLEDRVKSEAMSLVTINGGALVEQFDIALAAVMANVHDINADEGPRKVVLEVTIAPNTQRDLVVITGKVDRKLRGQAPIESTADVKLDSRGRVFGRLRIQQQVELFQNVKKIGGTDD